MKSRFALGALRTSQLARRELGRIAYDLICRHALCEHGHISHAEKRANAQSLAHGGRVVSRYRSNPCDDASSWVVVITERGGTHTTVYLESELLPQQLQP